MPDFDLLIKNGKIVDGTRIPAYVGDIAVRNGRVVAMGGIKGTAKEVIDATGLIVAPGFIDIHTHYDAALSGWDMYASLSGWHGVTTVSIGNCGFGFAPVRPEDRERAMLRMERTESIPLEVMKASMRWDWVTFPEFLNSLQKHGVGVNVASLFPYSPARSWVMGNEAARDIHYKAKPGEVEKMKNLFREAMEAGAFGLSGTFTSANRDYDGGYLPTHVAPKEEFLEMASVLKEYNRGSIEWSLGQSPLGIGPDFLVEMAQASGRPVNWNTLIQDPKAPGEWKRLLQWTEKINKQAVVLPINMCIPFDYDFTLGTLGLFDSLPAWRDATVGSLQERKAKLADPARRPALKDEIENAKLISEGNVEGEAGQLHGLRHASTFVHATELKKNEHLIGMSIEEISRKQGRHPIDVLLDLAVEEDLKTEFSLHAVKNSNEEAVAQIIKHPLSLIGSSDGGAHTKHLTFATYPTYFLSHWIRDKAVMSLEEAHWRLSTMIAWAIGIPNRGWLREGMPADIVVYDMAKLAVSPLETLHDLPNGDWRRVRRAEGYRYTIVNGTVTFRGQQCTAALPGKVLRSNEVGL